MEWKTESQLNITQNGVVAKQMNEMENRVTTEQNRTKNGVVAERNGKMAIFYGVAAF